MVSVCCSCLDQRPYGPDRVVGGNGGCLYGVSVGSLVLVALVRSAGVAAALACVFLVALLMPV